MAIQEKDRIECAIRHIQTAVDVDPWAVEIAVEAMKAQLSREDTTSDPISRQEAIDVLGVFTQADALGHTPKQIVEALPSVQPDTKAQLPGEGTTSDLISRQVAIDRINKQREHLQPDIYPQDKIGDAAYRICAEFIERLPSAQPESEERKAESAQNVPKEDLISRKAAIDAAESAFVRGVFPTVYIRELPSAQQETAKRIVGKSRDGMTLWYQCDMCNEPVDAQDDFCRGCGRRLTDG